MTPATSIPFGPEARALVDKPPSEQLRLLLEYLGTASKRKVELAMYVLTGGGKLIVSLLIHEAFAGGRRPTHAVRLLEIVGRIGGPVEFDEWMLIAAGRASPQKLVRAKCSQLLLKLGRAAKPVGPQSVNEAKVLIT